MEPITSIQKDSAQNNENVMITSTPYTFRMALSTELQNVNEKFIADGVGGNSETQQQRCTLLHTESLKYQLFPNTNRRGAIKSPLQRTNQPSKIYTMFRKFADKLSAAANAVVGNSSEEQAVQTLTSMGFSADRARNALQATKVSEKTFDKKAHQRAKEEKRMQRLVQNLKMLRKKK